MEWKMYQLAVDIVHQRKPVYSGIYNNINVPTDILSGRTAVRIEEYMNVYHKFSVKGFMMSTSSTFLYKFFELKTDTFSLQFKVVQSDDFQMLRLI